jgi:TPR repeat protein
MAEISKLASPGSKARIRMPIEMIDETACRPWLLIAGLVSLLAACAGSDEAPTAPTVEVNQRLASGDADQAEHRRDKLDDGPEAFDRLREAAEAGSSPAMSRLARGYRDGDFGEPDPKLAASWFERLIAEGEREAKTELAELLLSEEVGDVDAKRRAIRLLQEQIEDGDPRAMVLRAKLMDNPAAGKVSQEQAFDLYRNAAAIGSSEGLYRLGQLYFEGKGVDQDRTHAVSLWYDAADEGSLSAFLALGDVFARNLDRPIDQDALRLIHENAVKRGSAVARSIAALQDNDRVLGLEPARSLYQRAADGGSMAGVARLAAWLERFGQTDAALDWYLPAATSGDIAAMRRLFLAFGDPEASRFNPAIMRQWLEQASTLGAPWAMVESAIAAAGGHPFEIEGPAEDWLERAFRSDPRQAVAIAEAYREGRFGFPDNETAAIWLSRGADAGEWDAMRALAKAYAEGQGLGKSRIEAMRWYQAAAEAGDLAAMGELAGLQLASGDPGQARLAVDWLERAAHQGDVPAMRSLARTLMSGLATEADPAGAAKWYHAAAQAGDGEAHYQLGMMYLNGVGLKQDLTLARGLLNEALKHDVKQAAAALQMLDAASPGG